MAVTTRQPAQGFPQISAPITEITGNKGRVTAVWYKFFVNLWNDVLAAQGNNTFAPGDMKLISYLTPPVAWLLADGSTVSRVTYADLFLAIGTTYGVGDGSTTFNIPNINGTAPTNMSWIIHYGGVTQGIV